MVRGGTGGRPAQTLFDVPPFRPSLLLLVAGSGRCSSAALHPPLLSCREAKCFPRYRQWVRQCSALATRGGGHGPAGNEERRAAGGSGFDVRVQAHGGVRAAPRYEEPGFNLIDLWGDVRRRVHGAGWDAALVPAPEVVRTTCTRAQRSFGRHSEAHAGILGHAIRVGLRHGDQPTQVLPFSCGSSWRGQPSVAGGRGWPRGLGGWGLRCVRYRIPGIRVGGSARRRCCAASSATPSPAARLLPARSL